MKECWQVMTLEEARAGLKQAKKELHASQRKDRLRNGLRSHETYKAHEKVNNWLGAVLRTWSKENEDAEQTVVNPSDATPSGVQTAPNEEGE